VIKNEVLRVLREHQIHQPDPALVNSRGPINGPPSDGVDEMTVEENAQVPVVDRHTVGDSALKAYLREKIPDIDAHVTFSRGEVWGGPYE
jgi:hypothetical protein